MVKIYSHRGNLDGQNKDSRFEDCLYAINLDFNCEIDLWKIADKFLTGHDSPKEIVDLAQIKKYKENLLIHCKNPDCLNFFQTATFHDEYEYFYHEKDSYAFTSGGRLIRYPGKHIINNSLIMLPELSCIANIELKVINCDICTDYPIRYQKYIRDI